MCYFMTFYITYFSIRTKRVHVQTFAQATLTFITSGHRSELRVRRDLNMCPFCATKAIYKHKVYNRMELLLQIFALGRCWGNVTEFLGCLCDSLKENSQQIITIKNSSSSQLCSSHHIFYRPMFLKGEFFYFFHK